jgi:myosin heavy subunit
MAEMEKVSVDATMSRIEAAMNKITNSKNPVIDSPEYSTAIDLALDYDTRKSRLQDIESTTPSYNTRLSELEQCFRPYEEYSEECHTAIDQLKKLRDRIEGHRTEELNRIKALDARFDSIDQKFQSIDRSFDRIPAVFDDQRNVNNLVKSLLLRVQQLENQVNPKPDRTTTTLTSLSAQDLANTLVDRLALGETLSGDTIVRLSLSLGKVSAPAPPPDRLPFTPSTDVESTKRTAGEFSPEREPPRSRKRSRKAEEAEVNMASVPLLSRSAASPAKKRRGRLPKAVVRAEPAISEVQEEKFENEEEDENDEEEEDETPQIRRSGREPKPSTKHGEYLTWKQVKDRRKTTG